MTVLIWRIILPLSAIPSDGSVNLGGHLDTPRHGGQIQAVGSNHAEIVAGTDGSLTLYVMGIVETLSFPLAEKTLWAHAEADGAVSAQVLLHGTPQVGDPAGKSSVFTGQLPPALVGKPVRLALALPLDGQSQSLHFVLGLGPTEGGKATAPPHDTAATRIVATPPSTEEQALFLKPGGAYTQADIASNGGMTPQQKYAGMMANHHLHPKRGTYTCPITLTQANPKFPWTVGGKKYLFCCPPCISEFVKQAKLSPKGLKDPQEYLQK